MADSRVLDLGERSGTVAEHLEMDADDPYLPVPIREDFVKEWVRTEGARAGRAWVLVDGKEMSVPFSFFEEAEDFREALQACVDWRGYLAEWHTRAAERAEDAINAINDLGDDLDEL